MNPLRYTVNISFKNNDPWNKTSTIAERVKTLKEAKEYKSLIDNTVERACIIDNVTLKVVEWWVK